MGYKEFFIIQKHVQSWQIEFRAGHWINHIITCNCFMRNVIRKNILNRFTKLKNHIVYVDLN